MGKHVDLLFLSPPDVDFPQFVDVQDEHGESVQIGEWIRPDNDNPFWRLRVTTRDIVMQLFEETERQGQEGVRPADVELNARQSRPQPQQRRQVVSASSDAQSGRQSLKARFAGAAKKVAPVVADKLEPAMTAPEKCPSCGEMFDAATGELADCATCGDGKCPVCMPDVTEPCLDCQALSASPEEGGFDKSAASAAARKEAARATRGRLFDGVFHGKGGATSSDSDSDANEDEDED